MHAIYKRAGISRKMVTSHKKWTFKQKNRYKGLAHGLRMAVDRSNAEGRLMVYLDEVVFTKKTLVKVEYSNRY